MALVICLLNKYIYIYLYLYSSYITHMHFMHLLHWLPLTIAVTSLYCCSFICWSFVYLTFVDFYHCDSTDCKQNKVHHTPTLLIPYRTIIYIILNLKSSHSRAHCIHTLQFQSIPLVVNQVGCFFFISCLLLEYFLISWFLMINDSKM